MLNVDEYHYDVRSFAEANANLLQSFKNTRILITGAGGLIGSYLIDLLIEADHLYDLHTHILACDRDASLLGARFPTEYSGIVSCIPVDICNQPLPEIRVDYVIHAASNTSPIDYAQKPIDTILTNIKGTDVLCRYAIRNHAKRFLFCSSVEVYGRNNGDTDKFAEDYSGYVDCNTVRANYPSSKRCSESLCNAYGAEKPSFDFVITRIGRIYGPTILPNDTKAPTQFIRNAVNRNSIVLKSDGSQLYSWGYVGDCATALLFILQRGTKGFAYNVSDPLSCRSLKDFAMIAANEGNGQLEFTQQSAAELAGYSTITKATMSTEKIESLGWRATCHLETGIPRTVRILRSVWRASK